MIPGHFGGVDLYLLFWYLDIPVPTYCSLFQSTINSYDSALRKGFPMADSGLGAN